MFVNNKRVLYLSFIAVAFLFACERTPDPLPPKMVSEVDGKAMMLIPAGEFIMGTNRTDPENTHLKIGTVKPLYKDQHPEHKVHLDTFYIDQYEVTNREYKKFIDATQFPELPGHWEEGTFPEGGGRPPGYQRHLAGSVDLCALGREAVANRSTMGKDGARHRWPVVSMGRRKGWANVGVDGAKALTLGGSYPKDVSPYNVHDMAGNVMEWTSSWYQPYPGNDYQFKKFGKEFKVLRGNGFQKGGHYFLEAYRYTFYRTEAKPDEYFENVGFRCVLPVTSPK